MSTLTDQIREKRQRLAELEKEMAQIRGELREAKVALTGHSVSAKPGKPHSRHGFTNGQRSRPIQPDSSVDWARRVLQAYGQPLHIEELIKQIKDRGGPTVKKTTLISNLSRYIKHHDTFTRPATSVYGLREFQNEAKMVG